MKKYNKGWFTTPDEFVFHLLPNDDIDAHEESADCSCNPIVKVTDRGVVIITHNAFDLRELFECIESQLN